MLPQFTPSNQSSPGQDQSTVSSGGANYKLTKKYIQQYVFKMIRYKQMDFELAFFLMVSSVKAPSKLYQHTKRLKQIRNQWHRDDPCLVSAIICLLVLTGLIYGIIFSEDKVVGTLYMIFKFVVFHFLLSGVLTATLCKQMAERYLKKEDKKAVHQSMSSIEPMYAFDIHCNAFFPFYLIAYVLQVILALHTLSYS